MTRTILATIAAIGAVLLVLTIAGCPPARAAPPVGYVQTLNEDFNATLSRWSPSNTKGKWKSNFAFNPGAYDLPHSRSLPDEPLLRLDKAVHGVEPLNRVLIEGSKTNKALTMAIVSLSGKSGPKFVGSYADAMKPAVGFKKTFPYGGAMVSTEKSFNQTYGYFETRMTLPCVKGGWPAFWLLGEGGDEIDVLEHMGVNCQRIEHNVHSKAGGATRISGVRTPDMPASFNPRDFHIYGVKWLPDSITFYIDNVQTYQTKNPGLNRSMYLIANYSVGGWGGNVPVDPKIVGSQLKIDWIRAYQAAP